MTDMAKHEVPERRKSHLWVLALIAIPAAVEVVACWIGLGSLCGFPPVFGHGTGWTLAVGMETYAGYALWAWLSGAPGDRSRKFARGSAIAALSLSLVGQVAYHLMLASGRTRAPIGVVVFVACLLVVVLAFGATLMHLMHEDVRALREAEEKAAAAERQAAIERAEADERACLRRELDALSARADEDVAALRAELDEAASALASARREAETLTRKLASASGSGPRKRRAGSGGTSARKASGSETRKPEAATAPEADADLLAGLDDLDTEAKVLALMDRGHSASKAGILAGVSDARGRQIARVAKDLSRTAPQDVVDVSPEN